MNRPSIESEELERDPFEELASEFAERYRNGEVPSIEEYANSHPDLAEEIRELFPTIAAMEKSKARSSPTIKPLLETLPIQQLGDFRLLGEIGRGGMGIVYEAEQISLGRHVAVKVLPQQALLDERHLRRFEREAQTAAKLHHTNIVPVFGVGQQEGFNYIVMQFIAGVGLDEVLLALRRQVFDSEAAGLHPAASSSSRVSHANHNAQALLRGDFGEQTIGKLGSSFVRKQSPASGATVVGEHPTTDVAAKTVEFSLDAASNSSETSSEVDLIEDEAKQLKKLGEQFYRSVAQVGEQVADALAYAHEQGTLHRDIKPGNLLLDSTGTVWVADFGLAKFAEQDHVSRTGDIVGTLSYIPPESFSGKTDARGDIYSLGLSLFELLTLRPAFYGHDRSKLVREITEGNLPRLKKLNPYVPRDLETIVLKAVAHRPEDRYATANELASDLNCYLNDRPIKARRMSVPEQFTRWYRRNKLVAALSAAVLSLLLALTVVFGLLSHQEKVQRVAADQAAADARHQAAIADEKRAEARAQAAIAEKERRNAREFAYDAIESLVNVFVAFAPDRLPVSASSAFAQATDLTSQDLAEAGPDSEAGSNDAASTDLVAPPPIKQETAARLEILLGSLENLAAKAENNAEFAATFADLTLRVGTLHKALGNNERAAESLDKAIARYESLVSTSDGIENVIGLAVCLNERADLLGSMGSESESREYFLRAQQLLEKEQAAGRLKDSPRAQFELARTMFLMSIQRQQREGVIGRPRARPPRRFGLFGDAGANLRRAIELLEPLIEPESSPEYRYLLARCYSALSSASRSQEQGAYVQKANEVLEALVAAQPDVDDYKYEFAMAKLRRVANIVDVDERLEVTKQAVELLDQICGSNPDVFNYQIARSRALGRYVASLDRNATQLSTSAIDDDVNMSFFLRRIATDEADRAAQLFLEARGRFGEAYTERIPATYQVQLAEVVAKGTPDSAIQYFRDAILNSADDESLPRARAELGLARSLIMSNYGYTEASELLQQLNTKLRDQCEREAERWPNRDRFNDAYALWVETTYVLQSSLEKTQPIIAAMRDERLTKLRDILPDNLSILIPILEAELDIKTAAALARLGELEYADSLRALSQKKLEAVLGERPPQGSRRFQSFFAAYVLFELYDETDDVQSKLALHEKISKYRRRPGNPPPG